MRVESIAALWAGDKFQLQIFQTKKLYDRYEDIRLNIE
jgi:hypothetical protein